VNYQNGSGESGKYRKDLINVLSKQLETPDVCSLDVIWISELASQNRIIPFCETWTASWKEKYLNKPLGAVTYNNKIWAAPFRTDIGLLYYRTDTDISDIIPHAPITWDELEEQAGKAQKRLGLPYGYLWSGAQTENLVCEFLEVLSSFGGNILDPNDPEKVSLDTNEAYQALSKMRSWVQTISQGVIDKQRLSLLSPWKEGKAAFMREWPTSIVQFYKKGEDISNRFSIAPLPSSSPQHPGHSCLGGWNLGISAQSANQEDAWTFIEWMMRETNQYLAAIKASFTITLREAYTVQDDALREANPFFSHFKAIIDNAVSRPQIPHYPAFTKELQVGLYLAISGQKDVKATLKLLQKELQRILSS
jgi:multiple sugar transport system substrate-binding protein